MTNAMHIPLHGAAGVGKSILVDPDDFAMVNQLDWWCYDHPSYAKPLIVADYNDQSVVLSRLITGARDNQTVKHINGDPFDFRRANLRVETHKLAKIGRRSS